MSDSGLKPEKRIRKKPRRKGEVIVPDSGKWAGVRGRYYVVVRKGYTVPEITKTVTRKAYTVPDRKVYYRLPDEEEEEDEQLEGAA